MSPFDLEITGETPKAWVARHDESTIVEKSFIVEIRCLEQQHSRDVRALKIETGV